MPHFACLVPASHRLPQTGAGLICHRCQYWDISIVFVSIPTFRSCYRLQCGYILKDIRLYLECITLISFSDCKEESCISSRVDLLILSMGTKKLYLVLIYSSFSVTDFSGLTKNSEQILKYINYIVYFYPFQTWSGYCPFFFISVNRHETLPRGGFSSKEKLVSDLVETSHRVVWLRVKLVGALVMENRCGNGLVLPLYPPSSLSSCNEEQWLYSWREGTPSDPPPRPPPAPACLQWLCQQVDRWLGWVASGLCALSVIKERKKVYGLLVSGPPTDGMSSKHPPDSKSLEGPGRGCWVGGCGLQSAILKAAYWPRYWIILCSTVRQSGYTSKMNQIQPMFKYLWWYLHNVDAQNAAEVNANIFANIYL